jgi:arylsulfatase A-like enzyme
MISWKGHIPQGVIDREQLVSGIDLVPTLCDYAGIKNPPTFTGTSLRKIFEKPHSLHREYLVVELADDLLNPNRHGRMVRNKRYKYAIFNQGKDNEQLFDLWNDPGETQNLAYSPGYQSVKANLQEDLKKWMAQTKDNFVFPNILARY